MSMHYTLSTAVFWFSFFIFTPFSVSNVLPALSIVLTVQ